MKKKIYSRILAGMLFMAFSFFPATGFSMIIFVKQNAAGANNGSSWTDAYTDLQDALSVAAAGDEIWVAAGVYKPVTLIDLNGSGGSDPREAVFFIPDGVVLYGGFNGSEALVDERNWETNLTILSGDIDNNDLNTDGNFIAESTDDVAGSNAYHVVFTENAGVSTRIDGFIITAGKADIGTPVDPDDPNRDGGGWYNLLSAPVWASSPVVANTSFIGNYAESEGGGFYSLPGPAGGESVSLFESCLFSQNKAGFTAGAIYMGSFNPGNYAPEILSCRFVANEAFRRGGAIYLVGDHAEISESVFENNLVTAVSPDMSTLPGSGGAVSLVASNAVFSAVMFHGNSATGNPTGAFEGGGGGAVYMSANDPQTASLGPSSPKFNGCGFYENSAAGNTAAWGGAMVYLSDAGILQPFLVNCVFSENEAQNHGGAVAGFTRVISDPAGFTPVLEPVFTNCTFYGNTAGQLGGAIYHSGYEHEGSQVLEAVVENSILWGNSAATDGDQIYSTGDAVIRYSLVEGSGGSGAGWDTDLGADGGGNIDSNAGFVNAASPLGADAVPATNDDGLRLTQFSDAVNAGDDGAAGLAGITEDYTGAVRIFSGTVDMGAYERAGIILPDFDFVWLVDWPQIQPPCLTCPFPWSFLLFRDFEKVPHYVWKEPAKFIRMDNEAVITGEIVNAAAPEIRFFVYLKLFREHSWESWNRQQGTWFSETEASESVAATAHVNWKFWRLSTASYLKGTGEITGILQLKQWDSSEKTGFQMGRGANAWDGDFGMAGYFVYNGKLSYEGKKLQVKGLGSFNADAIPCEENCEEQFYPVAGEIDSHELKSGSLGNQKDEEIIQVYPVPAGEILTLESAVSGEGNSAVKILNASGQILISENWDRRNERHIISLKTLTGGLYVVQVIPPGESGVYTRWFLKK